MDLHRFFSRLLAKAAEQTGLFGPNPIKDNPELTKKKVVDKRGHLTTKYVRREKPKPKAKPAAPADAQADLFGSAPAPAAQATPPAPKRDEAPALHANERELAGLLENAIREADEAGDSKQATYLRRYLEHMTGSSPAAPRPPASSARTPAAARPPAADPEPGEFDDYGEEIKFSRKHLAQIRSELEGKSRVMRLSDLETLEEDPAVASTLVNKDAVIGSSMEDLRTIGLSAGGAYLFTKLVSIIPKKAAADTPRDRRLYVMGVQRVMSLLESARSVDDVREGMDGLADLRFGHFVPADLADEDRQLRKAKDDALATLQIAIRVENGHRETVERYKYRMAAIRVDEGRGIDRSAEREELEATYARAKAAIEGGGESTVQLRSAYGKTNRAYREFQAKLEALDKDQEYPWADALDALGDRFTQYLGIYMSRGSDSTRKTKQKHVNEAKAYESADDWGWQGKKKGGSAKPRSTKPKWEREGPEDVIREGGKVRTFTSESLAATFGMRGVQYGNWMDEESSREHTQRAGEAFLDLADILGITPEQVSLKGRLGIGFGARGSGRVKAHYEPGMTVINMTKWKGGGSLAHEWGHFLDNVLGRLSFDDKGGHTTMATDVLFGAKAPTRQQRAALGEHLPERVLDAIEGVRKAIYEGDFVGTRTVEVNEAPTRTMYGRKVKVAYRGWATGKMLLDKHGGDPQAALAQFAKDQDPARYSMERNYKRAVKNIRDAAGWFYAQGGEKPLSVEVPDFAGAGSTPSAFVATAQKMGDYYKKPVELFARAFESWVSDELKATGRRNTYLVSGVAKDDAAAWARRNPVIGERTSLYPRDAERERVNAAMRTMIDALHQDDTFSKALATYLPTEAGR